MLKQILEDPYGYAIFMLFCLVFMLLGGLLNVNALVLNDGRMPVQTNEFINTSIHFNFSNSRDVNQYWLTDIIYLPGTMVSIGDIFIMLGMSAGFILVELRLFLNLGNFWKRWRAKSINTSSDLFY